VVPGAHSHALPVEHLSDVVGVDTADVEGDDASAPVVWGAKNRVPPVNPHFWERAPNFDTPHAGTAASNALLKPRTP
jgi:hypothetical protein